MTSACIRLGPSPLPLAVRLVDHARMRRDARSVGARPGPWFRQHPLLAVVVAIVLYTAVFVLRLAVEGPSEATVLLFVLPIALLALAFGARAGLLAGAGGVVLLASWVLASDASVTPLGWVARATPMLLLGALVGAASDRLRDAAEVERRLLLARSRQRQAAEINDSIIQRLVAAKWALEKGDTSRGVDLVTESIETAEALVAELLAGDVDRAIVRSSGRPVPHRTDSGLFASRPPGRR